MDISSKVKKLRQNKGWSQDHLATVSGLSTKTVQRIESGNNASLESQQALASVFKINVGELIYNDFKAEKSNPKEYILEVYFEGDCIEQQTYAEPIIPPLPGEQFYIIFQNKNYSENYGNCWIVEKRKHLKFNQSINIETLMLDCKPDPNRGA